VTRPKRLVAVVGTGTDIGKTYVTARLLGALRAEGTAVAARKPAQSFDLSDDPADRDAAVLGAASGEASETVCPSHRWYEVAMAPPIAAALLGRPPFTVADLVEELQWPRRAVDVGFLETAGGLRSPIAADGDCLALVHGAKPDFVLLVGDAGLGTINLVRLTIDSLLALGTPIAVVLNRFDESSQLHRGNLSWLRERDGFHVLRVPGDESELATLARKAS
jgi:dethiobiotin synthetase